MIFTAKLERNLVSVSSRSFQRIFCHYWWRYPTRPALRTQKSTATRDGGTDFFPTVSVKRPSLKIVFGFFGAWRASIYKTKIANWIILTWSRGRTMMKQQLVLLRQRREYAVEELIFIKAVFEMSCLYFMELIEQIGGTICLRNTTSSVPQPLPSGEVRWGAAY